MSKNKKSILTTYNLNKSIKGTLVIKNLNLFIPKNKIIGIIGPNGAGKSTLINLISGFLFPDKGHIYYKNIDVSYKKMPERVKLGILRTFQETFLFDNLTVKQVLALYKYSENFNFKSLLNFINEKNLSEENFDVPKEVIKILDDLNINDVNEFFNKNCKELSFGQKKLLEFFRIFFKKNATLILLDEPVEGVNPLIREVIDKSIKKLSENKTIVFVEHDIDFVKNLADLVIVLYNGELLDVGKPKEVLEKEEIVKKYLSI